MKPWLSMACVVAGCAVLGAGAVTHAQTSSLLSVRRVTLPARPAVVVRALPPGPCRVPMSVAGPAAQLVPGTPCAIVLSRYRGLPARPGTQLVARVRVRRASLLVELASEFDALRPMPPGSYACPEDNGSEIEATLKYPRQQALEVAIALSGCRTVARGQVHRWAAQPPGGKLLAQLERLLARR